MVFGKVNKKIIKFTSGHYLQHNIFSTTYYTRRKAHTLLEHEPEWWCNRPHARSYKSKKDLYRVSYKWLKEVIVDICHSRYRRHIPRGWLGPNNKTPPEPTETQQKHFAKHVPSKDTWHARCCIDLIIYIMILDSNSTIFVRTQV